RGGSLPGSARGVEGEAYCQQVRRRPTTEQILRLFSLAERHSLLSHGQSVKSSLQPRADRTAASRAEPAWRVPTSLPAAKLATEIDVELRPRCAECRTRRVHPICSTRCRRAVKLSSSAARPTSRRVFPSSTISKAASM